MIGFVLSHILFCYVLLLLLSLRSPFFSTEIQKGSESEWEEIGAKPGGVEGVDTNTMWGNNLFSIRREKLSLKVVISLSSTFFVSLGQIFIPCVLNCNLGFPLDLLRCESLLGLDPATCSRVLNKNYSLLVSMAPLTNEIRPVSSCTPQVMTHLRIQMGMWLFYKETGQFSVIRCCHSQVVKCNWYI